jgi:hypothetical protein
MALILLASRRFATIWTRATPSPRSCPAKRGIHDFLLLFLFAPPRHILAYGWRLGRRCHQAIERRALCRRSLRSAIERWFRGAEIRLIHERNPVDCPWVDGKKKKKSRGCPATRGMTGEGTVGVRGATGTPGNNVQNGLQTACGNLNRTPVGLPTQVCARSDQPSSFPSPI